MRTRFSALTSCPNTTSGCQIATGVKLGLMAKTREGSNRIHQFQKVEQVVLCANDAEVSAREHEHILQNAEEILQALHLPYRVVVVCGGDLGHPRLEYDISLWMSQITSTHHDHTIGQVQCLQDLLGVLQDVFVFPGRDLCIVGAQNDLFDFLKLVNTVEPRASLP